MNYHSITIYPHQLSTLHARDVLIHSFSIGDVVHLPSPARELEQESNCTSMKNKGIEETGGEPAGTL
jgi:hypothetical protein